MIYNKRSDEAIKTELDYLKEYVVRVFGKALEKEAFHAQLDELITSKIRDYIYQRYRDWTAPEIARLRDAWDAKPIETATQDDRPRRGRPVKVDHGSQIQTG
jgi:hypothetical protein